jgi:septal ring factor EnvC (AmiA/AmiB activator)
MESGRKKKLEEMLERNRNLLSELTMVTHHLSRLLLTLEETLQTRQRASRAATKANETRKANHVNLGSLAPGAVEPRNGTADGDR